MKRILFVCHGNICRSPMAEMIFSRMLAEAGLEKEFSVASAATSSEEIWNGVGNPVYPPAVEELARHGITVGGKRARLLLPEDAQKFDLFVGMDSANIRNMHRILGEGASGRIHKLLSFAGQTGDVSDPWYSRRFDVAYDDIYKGCAALLATLREELK